MARHVSRAAVAAKSIRSDLKYAFPSTKFKVHTSNYSGGSSVSVSWENGPTDSMVQPVVGKYADGRFDGMTDCYVMNPDAVGGTSYVQTRRAYSDGAEEYVGRLYCKKAGVAYSGPDMTIDGNYLSREVYSLLLEFDMQCSALNASVQIQIVAGRFALVDAVLAAETEAKVRALLVSEAKPGVERPSTEALAAVDRALLTSKTKAVRLSSDFMTAVSDAASDAASASAGGAAEAASEMFASKKAADRALLVDKTKEVPMPESTRRRVPGHPGSDPQICCNCDSWIGREGLGECLRASEAPDRSFSSFAYGNEKCDRFTERK